MRLYQKHQHPHQLQKDQIGGAPCPRGRKSGKSKVGKVAKVDKVGKVGKVGKVEKVGEHPKSKVA